MKSPAATLSAVIRDEATLSFLPAADFMLFVSRTQLDSGSVSKTKRFIFLFPRIHSQTFNEKITARRWDEIKI